MNSSTSNNTSSLNYNFDDSRPPMQGWLGKLVWDPRDDNFQRATSKVVERRRELFLSCGTRRQDSVSVSYPRTSDPPGTTSADMQPFTPT